VGREEWLSEKSYKPQATSCKPQAPSANHQAPRNKLKNIIESLLNPDPRISDREA
jgi:hypothetical protein